jgi:hypothetical protein
LFEIVNIIVCWFEIRMNFYNLFCYVVSNRINPDNGQNSLCEFKALLLTIPKQSRRLHDFPFGFFGVEPAPAFGTHKDVFKIVALASQEWDVLTS